jgi:succinate dehydrogenase/fumarate reductase flavoprotein subunit
MIAAASAREESRGVHLRVDFPRLDQARWQQHLAFRRPGD